MHNTPLAGLAALTRTRTPRSMAAELRNDRLPFLKQRRHFMYAGTDADGREVYAVWMKSDGVILTRLIESFADLYKIPRREYTVHQVGVPRDFGLRLAALAYRLGLFGTAHRLLSRYGARAESPDPGFAGVD